MLKQKLCARVPVKIEQKSVIDRQIRNRNLDCPPPNMPHYSPF